MIGLDSTFPTRELRKGVIKWFNQGRKFGFVIPDDGSKEVFIHIKDGSPRIFSQDGLTTFLDGFIEPPNQGDRIIYKKQPPKNKDGNPQGRPWAIIL